MAYEDFNFTTFWEQEDLEGNPINFMKKLKANLEYLKNVSEALGLITGIPKADGAGNVSAAEADVDYVVPVKSVYTAFLNQPTVTTTSGAMVVGKTYVIDTLETGDDFSNVGYVEEGTAFEATGTTPTAWTEGTVVQNLTDWIPVATALQDQLSGPVFARTAAGTFTITKAGAFTSGKTVPVKDIYSDQDGNVLKLTRTSADVMTLETYAAADTETKADGVLSNHYINIEVYN